MDNNQVTNEIQVELTDEIAQGIYSNLAVIAHSTSEFIIDFIRVLPGTPKAQVKSRIILTPDNAKRLLYALQDNIKKFDDLTKHGKQISFDQFIPPIGGIQGQA
ncbi:MAG: DUF3467 domain-containing protein [Tannerella sp.]|jgi:hypothetical protein|nr:DUF3467 domain-containing protein [Tannerella sp.]